MRNLDLHTINSLDEVGDDTNFIMVIEETDGWVEILQGTRKEIFVKLIDLFHIEEDEFDNMSDILIHVEDVNGDGYPLVKIYTV
tara:strand:+ start:1213 stop:1464 length:252 start_codon:yes stop_codon:yes gene_type:complete